MCPIPYRVVSYDRSKMVAAHDCAGCERGETPIHTSMHRDAEERSICGDEWREAPAMSGHTQFRKEFQLCMHARLYCS
jgi:hypothetical protein